MLLCMWLLKWRAAIGEVRSVFSQDPNKTWLDDIANEKTFRHDSSVLSAKTIEVY
jgi:hypothetical protein